MAPNRQRADGEGRAWIVPVLAALVLGSLVLGLLLGGVSLRGDDEAEPDPPTVATDRQAETEEGAPTVVVTGPPEAIARHAQRHWAAALREQGREDFEPARVRGFTEPPRSACETEARADGPFYCAEEDTVYLQTEFLEELPRDAQAYLVGHLVAHHIQDFIGVTGEVNSRQLESGREEAARLGVAYELQADCFTGVWASAAEEDRVAGFDDLEAMFERVSEVAGERLDPAGSQLRPEIFSHAPAASRAVWFERGRESRDPGACDPFETDES